MKVNKEKIVRRITDAENRLKELKSNLCIFYNFHDDDYLEILNEAKELLNEIELLLKT